MSQVLQPPLPGDLLLAEDGGGGCKPYFILANLISGLQSTKSTLETGLRDSQILTAVLIMFCLSVCSLSTEERPGQSEQSANDVSPLKECLAVVLSLLVLRVPGLDVRHKSLSNQNL